MTTIIGEPGSGGLGDGSDTLIPLPGGYTAGDLAQLGFMPPSILQVIKSYQVPGLVLQPNGFLYRTSDAPQSLNDWVNEHVADAAEAATKSLGDAASVVGTAAHKALHPLERALPWIIGGGLLLGYLILSEEL